MADLSCCVAETQHCKAILLQLKKKKRINFSSAAPPATLRLES